MYWQYSICILCRNLSYHVPCQGDGARFVCLLHRINCIPHSCCNGHADYWVGDTSTSLVMCWRRCNRWKFYLVFVCCSFAAFVFTYFCIPEVSDANSLYKVQHLTWCIQTARLSLEEINAIFGDTVVVDLTNATMEEKAKVDAAVLEKTMEEHVEG